MKLISKAIKSLCPEAEYVIENEDYSTIRWIVEPEKKPTLKQLEAELKKIEEKEKAEEYKQQRKNEYPLIAEQLDMIWHGMDSGVLPKVEDFYNAIKAIKDRYPKP